MATQMTSEPITRGEFDIRLLIQNFMKLREMRCMATGY